jgi:hypothetical protein
MGRKWSKNKLAHELAKAGAGRGEQKTSPDDFSDRMKQKKNGGIDGELP